MMLVPGSIACLLRTSSKFTSSRRRARPTDRRKCRRSLARPAPLLQIHPKFMVVCREKTHSAPCGSCLMTPSPAAKLYLQPRGKRTADAFNSLLTNMEEQVFNRGSSLGQAARSQQLPFVTSHGHCLDLSDI